MPARHLALLAGATTVVLWASAFVGIRVIGQAVDPGPFALGRLLVGATALGAFAAARRSPRPRGRGLLLTAVFGVTWFAAYTVTLNAAGQRLDAGTAAMLVNIGPLLIALGAGAFLGEGFPRRLVVGLVVAFAGVAVIAASGGDGRATTAGIALGIASAVLYAVGVLVQKVALRTVDATAATAWGCAAGAVVLLPFAPALVTQLAAAEPGVLLAVVYLGVFPTALAFWLWGYALSHASAGQTASTSLAVPAVTVLLSWALLREVPAPLALLGGALALAGVTASRWPSRAGRVADVADAVDPPDVAGRSDASGRA
jgi:drug/metabolite transporter (DMT)-like permease